MNRARNNAAVALTPARCQSCETSEFYKGRLNSSCTSYCHYRQNEAKTDAPWMVKMMKFEVSVSVATAATAATTATVNRPKAVVAGKVYLVVNTNHIPVNRIARRKRRVVCTLEGKHKLSNVMLRN
jgi:hypothetical protein